VSVGFAIHPLFYLHQYIENENENHIFTICTTKLL